MKVFERGDQMSTDHTVRLYTIKEVSLKTGLSTQLIRKWEERYEAVMPSRFPNGYRGYTRENVDKLLWLKSRVDSGVPIGLAIVDYNQNGIQESVQTIAISDEILDESNLNELQQQFLNAFIAMDIEKVQAFFERLLTLHSTDFVLIHVLQPVLVEIGTKWEHGVISEYQEHFASNFIREKINAIRSLIPPAPERPELVTACLPNERHDIGMLYFNYFAAKQGFPTIYLGPSPAETGIIDCLRHRKPSAFIFSVSSLEIYRSNETFLMELDRIITQEKHLTKVFLGGRVINEDKLYPGTEHIYELAGNSHDTIAKIRKYLFE